MDNSKEAISDLCYKLLATVGEDPHREGLLKTPDRFARSILEMTSGYSADLEQIINGAIFTEPYSEMVIVKNIEFYSLCEHHLLPFFGKVHVGYIPNGKIIGLSKIPRLVNVFAKRLQVQERFTHQLAECLNEILTPNGVAVVAEAKHLCMMMRGVEVQNGSMITNTMTGDFINNHATRSEFLSAINKTN